MTEKNALRNFVGGEYVELADGRYADLIDPSTGEVFATAPVSGAEDVARAMAAASSAFEKWRVTTPRERQLAMLRFADALEARAEELVDARTGRPPFSRTAVRGATTPPRRARRPCPRLAGARPQQRDESGHVQVECPREPGLSVRFGNGSDSTSRSS